MNKSKRGPWEIVQVREFSLDGKEQISMTPRARAHKELTIRTPSRVVKPKARFASIMKHDTDPKVTQQFEFAATKKQDKKSSTEDLAIINDKSDKNLH